MSRKLTCPGCHTNYTLADAFKASTVVCKKCGATIGVDSGSPQPVAARPRTASPREIHPPGNLSGKRQRAMQKGKPIYTSPIFYVAAVATVLCAYFAVKFH